MEQVLHIILIYSVGDIAKDKFEVTVHNDFPTILFSSLPLLRLMPSAFSHNYLEVKIAFESNVNSCISITYCHASKGFVKLLRIPLLTRYNGLSGNSMNLFKIFVIISVCRL